MKRQVDLLQDVADKVLLAGDSVLGRSLHGLETEEYKSISPLPKYALHTLVCCSTQ